MGNTLNKIAIFLPRPTAFYVGLFQTMKRGFEEIGYEVYGAPSLLDRDELLGFCQGFNPDVIFEMNRTKAQIPWLPDKIIHIGWIVDRLGYPLEYFRDSDILYFFEAGYDSIYQNYWEKRYHERPKGIVDWLPPAFCPDTYFKEDIKPEVDFSFLGHISLPWTDEELNRQIAPDLTFGKFHDYWNKHPKECCRRGNRIFEELTDHPVEISDQTLRYDTTFRISRMTNRTNMMNCILSASSSVHIHGPDNWRSWPDFEPFYVNFLDKPEEIRRAILSSKISIHEGNGIHFRLFDIMGTGRCVFYHRNPFRRKEGAQEIELLFEPDRHFVYFNDENIKEKAYFYVDNVEAREQIAQEASKLVHAKHKWSDRALKIKSDLQKIQ